MAAPLPTTNIRGNVLRNTGQRVLVMCTAKRFAGYLFVKFYIPFRNMADYLVGRYDNVVIQRFMTMDIESKLASLRTADDFE